LSRHGRTRNLSGDPSAFVPSRETPHPPSWRSQTARSILVNSIGAAGSTVGEVVFNTSMTGYQEILTDPSYCQQIVTLTYPHIGNTGTNAQDVESDKVHAAGLIIRNLPLLASNFRATQSLSDYLVAEGTVAIANIDTRQLTRQLRSGGAQNGCILALGRRRVGDAPSHCQSSSAGQICSGDGRYGSGQGCLQP
jgi:carbamoyl-phosphate synthase small subunit